MNYIGKPEIATQKRVINVFEKELGYKYLGDWHKREANSNIEEVTVKDNHEKRPDLVLYINGIAVVVIELKNSRVSIGDGIRQHLGNQDDRFIKSFFTTR
jgi:type I restriction enzyme R subunit